MSRPALCENCQAGELRGMCRTYPMACEDLRDIWDDGFSECVRAVKCVLKDSILVGVECRDEGKTGAYFHTEPRRR